MEALRAMDLAAERVEAAEAKAAEMEAAATPFPWTEGESEGEAVEGEAVEDVAAADVAAEAPVVVVAGDGNVAVADDSCPRQTGDDSPNGSAAAAAGVDASLAGTFLARLFDFGSQHN